MPRVAYWKEIKKLQKEPIFARACGKCYKKLENAVCEENEGKLCAENNAKCIVCIPCGKWLCRQENAVSHVKEFHQRCGAFVASPVGDGKAAEKSRRAPKKKKESKASSSPRRSQSKDRSHSEESSGGLKKQKRRESKTRERTSPAKGKKEKK